MFPSDRTLLRTRRRRLLLALASLPAWPAAATSADGAVVRIGLTPVFLDDQVSFLGQWRAWLEKKLDRAVVFVQRGNYREISDLLRAGKIDFAWLCGYPYIRHRREFRLVAVPLWRGQPLYQSYLIVPADDHKTHSIGELRGKVFAYSDPDSNSGFLYPQYLLLQQGERPSSFFARTFFTWAHRKVVEAVGVGLADGGAVDGYVWETLAEGRPDLTAATRIINRSPLLGYPPFVARSDIPARDLEQFRQVLLGMQADPLGSELLGRLRLDGFTVGKPALFDGIAQMAERVDGK
ncbi:MAG: ABC transporter substrate-binding protein [Betaproteobacteria bacterium HGW-Betaproteobacteria-7]|nr:MAG: ABC transporter substrate-binding protein [Betaproteobacteria bacterium HGW-Betaproteobacteria-7]